MLTFSTEWSRQNFHTTQGIMAVEMFPIAHNKPVTIVGDVQDRERFPLHRSHAATQPIWDGVFWGDVMPTFVRISECSHTAWCADISGVMSVVFGVQMENPAWDPAEHAQEPSEPTAADHPINFTELRELLSNPIPAFCVIRVVDRQMTWRWPSVRACVKTAGKIAPGNL